MPADSLLDMARRACARNVHRITDIGDLDYDLIRPILLKIESPEKLHQLELSSPQIIGHDAEIWLNFIKRDIPDWDTKRHEPSNPKNWYKVYKKLKAEATKDSSNDEAMLKAALADIQKGKEQNTAEIASTARSVGLYSSSNAPGPSRKARIAWNYISGKTGSKGASKMTLLEKIRKEARNAKAAKMNRPMHELHKKQTGVVKAPAQFVEEVKKMKVLQATEAKKHLSPPPKRPVSGVGTTGTVGTSRPPMHAPPTQASKPKPQPAVANGGKPYDLTSDRESRLRALKSGRPVSRVVADPKESQNTNGSLTLDFLEDSEDDDSNQGQPKRKRDAADDNAEMPRKMLKPNNALTDELLPRSRSPMKLSPAPGSRPQGLQPLKRKHEAPNLFHTSPNKRPKPV
ncbi:uncharacterized protein Z520_11176 [Fonsecaea multimorphosa CBS 102226]|uniref:Elongin-A n=1 Tax=Fonsecaea multimorphosa CBS 102226 TaxID=1442371 RepID=A0A0D2JRP4_9EURO|nr:uncharacterized protein Z520_11176 [Fonsecaea multimorphosa CBS 102226]KIX93119.1 hypothetical protein Z520_11176 [Fonsecaea multimorphosa CBS 102226]OAL18321.1 hypothetical protein AYO22_10737 [Fonsecaea multimorphosa]